MRKTILLASLAVMTFNVWGMILNNPDGNSGNNNEKNISQIFEKSEENDRNVELSTSQQPENSSKNNLNPQWSFEQLQTLLQQWSLQQQLALSEEQVLILQSVVVKDINRKVFSKGDILEYLFDYKYQHPYDSSALNERVEGKRQKWREWLNIIEKSRKFGVFFEDLLFFSAEHGFLNLAQHLVKEKGWKVNKENNGGKTPLHIACESGNGNIVKCLVEHGANCNMQNYDGETPLHIAVQNEKEKFVKYLVEHGADVNKADDAGRTPLFEACESGNGNIVKYLVEHGADVNKTDEYGMTPLFYACWKGNENIVKYLVEHGADINKENEYGETPLFKAFSSGNENVVKYLIKQGAGVNKADDAGRTPLFEACESGNGNIVKYLVEHGADVNQKSRSGHIPLICAAERRNEDIANFLIEHGADVNAFNKNNTLLIEAILLKKETAAIYLIDHGANVNIVKQNNGWSPLFFAIKKGNERLVRYLIEHNANVNQKSNNGDTPLICAVKKRNEDIAKFLIEHGADVNAKNDNGESPLILVTKKKKKQASQQNPQISSENDYWSILEKEERYERRKASKISILEELLNHPNIDPNGKDNEGNSPLDYSILRNKSEFIYALLDHEKINVDIKNKDALKKFVNEKNSNNTFPLIDAVNKGNINRVKSLVKAGADVDCVDEAGDTALTLSCFYDYEIARILVENGADVNKKNRDGKNPLWTAFDENRKDIMKLFIDKGAKVEDISVKEILYFDCDFLLEYLLNQNKISLEQEDLWGNTLLHDACAEGSLNIVRLLLKHNMDVNASNDNGETPLYIADKYGHENIVKYLVEQGANVNKENNDGETPLPIAHEGSSSGSDFEWSDMED